MEMNGVLLRLTGETTEETKERIKQLREKYKPLVKTPQKTAKELKQWIEWQFDTEPLSMSCFTQAFITGLKSNITNGAIYEHLRLSPEDMLFMAWKLPNTERNGCYYAIPINTKEQFIYIVMEMNSANISTNHVRLYVELIKERGISQYDFDHNTKVLDYHIAYYNMLEGIN